MADRMAINLTITGNYLQRRSIGGKLIVGISKVWHVLIIQCQHVIQLPLHLIFHFRINLIKKGAGILYPFAQHQQHCALHIITLLQTGCGFGGNGPRRRHAQACTGQNHRQIGPDCGILMGKHHHLQSVVRHMFG